MSGPRLQSMHSNVYRATNSVLQAHSSLPPRSRARATAFFHASRSRQQDTKPTRYGTANQLPPHLKPKDDSAVVDKAEEVNSASAIALYSSPLSSPTTRLKALPAPANDPTSKASRPDVAATDVKPPMDRVIDMDSPNQPEDSKPPHLQTPPYVHHFDTFSLVRDLQKGGFTEDQTVDIMKAIRGLLGENMNLARRALVSKSNVENELYLFRAACSELKTEIQNNRKSEAEKWRSQRAQLQHEVDIIGQSMTQNIASLKEELRGIFDDRKMNVRMQQKKLDGEIQELNYKITVALNSDSRSTIEGIRWVLTRRAAMALGAAVIMVVGTLQYSRYMVATQEAERKKHASDMAQQQQIMNAIVEKKGSTQGLAEEVLLVPEGVSGG